MNLFAVNDSELEDNKLYPGVSGSYLFSISNPNVFPVLFDMSISEAEHAAGGIPLEYRLKLTDGAYLAGGADSWLSPAKLAEVSVELAAGGSVGYTLEWRWPYESGDDARDAALGSNEDRSHLVTITVRVEQKV